MSILVWVLDWLAWGWRAVAAVGPDAAAAPGASRKGDLESGGNGGQGGRQHTQRVYLRLDYITDGETRALLFGQRIVTLVGWGLLAWEVYVKFEKSGSYLLTTNTQEIVNVAFGGCCMAALLVAGALFFRRAYQAHQSGKHWTRDRQRLVWYSGAALLLETLIIALWLAANAYSLVVECGWFDRAMGIMAFFGWTAMSTTFYLHIAQGFSLLPELPSQAAAPNEAPRRHVAPSRVASSLVGSTLAGHATAASTQGSHCPLNWSGMGAAAADKDKLAPAEADADADPAGVAGCEQAEAAHAAARAALAAQRHHATPFTEGHLPSSSSGQLGGGASMQSALTNNKSELDSSSSSEEDGAESRAGSQSGKDAASGSGTVARRRHSRRSEHLAMLACLLLWVPVKAALVVILLADLGYIGPSQADCVVSQPDEDCRDWDYSACCMLGTPIVAATAVVGVIFIFKFALVAAVMMWVLWSLKQLPYHTHRMKNVAVRLQLHTRLLHYLLYIASFCLMYYIQIGSCTSTLQIWGLGPGPFHVFMTGMVVTEAFFYMPSDPKDSALKVHTALQQFAWTEAEVPAKLAARSASVQGGVSESEPLFCVETALKLTYVSLHMYRHFRPESTISSMDTLLGLYGLRHYEWYIEPLTDTHCLLAWGPDTMVIGFRGTQSMANIQQDIKIWRTALPPKRGSELLRTCPMVHTGFLKSWTARGLNARVLQRVREVLEGGVHSQLPELEGTRTRCCAAEGEGAPAEDRSDSGSSDSCSSSPREPEAASSASRAERSGSSSSSSAHGCGGSIQRILVTGHSLGGALAALCSTDLARVLGEWYPDAVPGEATAAAAAAMAAAGAQAAGEAGAGRGVKPCRRTRPSIKCYTLGCPRVGNAAFSALFAEMVPDCFTVINDQDAIAKQGKFIFLFKRSGKPVIINGNGDLIVSPSYIERSMLHTGKSSLSQHLLMSYFAAWAAILRGQQASEQQRQQRRRRRRLKQLPGGERGVRQLLQCGYMQEMMVKVLGFRRQTLLSITAHAHSQARLRGRLGRTLKRLASSVGGSSVQAAAAGGEPASAAAGTGEAGAGVAAEAATEAEAVAADDASGLSMVAEPLQYLLEGAEHAGQAVLAGLGVGGGAGAEEPDLDVGAAGPSLVDMTGAAAVGGGGRPLPERRATLKEVLGEGFAAGFGV